MARTAYNPGLPTVPVKIGPGVYSIDSFRGEGSYTVTLEGNTALCSCPDFKKRGLERPCKHVKRCRAARAEELAAKAQALSTADLERLLPKYEAKGDLQLAVVLRGELFDRMQAVGA